MGLTACFRKAKYLEPSELKEIRSVADAFKKEDGLNEKDAVTKAINLAIADELADYNDLYQAITEKGGVIPSPEELNKIYLPSVTDQVIPVSNLDAIESLIDDEMDSIAKELADLFKSESGTLRSGVNPKILELGAKLGALYIAKGVVSFAQYGRAIINHLSKHGVDANQIKPTLKKMYFASMDDVTDNVLDKMDDVKTVRAFELSDLDTKIDVRGDENVQQRRDEAAPGLDTEQTGPNRGGGLDAEQGGNAANQGDLEAGQPGNGQGTDRTVNSGQNNNGDALPEGQVRAGNDSAGIPDNGRQGAGGAGLAVSGPGGNGGTGAGRPGGTGAGASGGAGSNNQQTNNPVVHFHIEDPLSISGGGQVARFNKNQAAIELYHDIKTSGNAATNEEKKILAGYTGWGSFGQELFQGNWENPAPKSGWESRDEWLREHLGASEWKSAQRSITNSHYTDPPTVMAMWDMIERMGFTGGRLLEPGLGVGNFFGMMPKSIKAKSNLSGIELDELTGGIAKMIYPDANISIKGYQESKTPDNFYDLIVGNWPFENTAIADRRYQKINPMLHDYYFLKAIDQARPGGLIVGITSKGTLDKVNASVRLAMAKKAELVAAYRLPSGAFEEYAGTKVVTDIIILRKRESPIGIVNDNWIDSVEMDTPSGEKVKVNNYYHENPTHVIGTIDYGHGTTFKRPGMIVHRPDDMAAQLKRVVDLTPEGVYEKNSGTKHISYITNHTDNRQGALTKTKDGLFVVHGEHLAPANDIKKYILKEDGASSAKNKKTNADRELQLTDLIGLRNDYAKLIESERGGDSEAETTALRNKLKKAHNDFVHKHGVINKSWGADYMRMIGDPFFPVVSAMETNKGTKEKPVWKPATILSRSTSRSKLDIDNPGIQDAFVLARNKSVSPSLKEIAKIANQSEQIVKAELIKSGAVFEDQGGDVIPGDIYLSGNVRQKLREAMAAVADGNNALERNVKALQKVIPKDIPYHEIEARMGAPWVGIDVYKEYIAFMLNRPGIDDIEVQYVGGRWKVKIPRQFNHLVEAKSGFGLDHHKTPFSKLVNAAISNQTIVVKEKDVDGTVYTDTETSTAANNQIAKIRDEFTEWVWRDPERRVLLEKEYNESRNSWASPYFDGSFMQFEGMSLELGNQPFNLRDHQVNAIWQAIVNRKSLNAHEVGTGKTFTIAGIAIESRRYGIAKKPLILAHNANSASVASEILEMYPAAKVLYIDNMSPATIDLKLRQIANDDWDAIVMPHSLIGRMALTEETLMGIAQEEIAMMEAEAREAAEDDGVTFTDDMLTDEKELAKLRSATAKDLVKQRNRIIENIRKQGQRASKEGAISFEELGIDMIMVDEAHEFKKPPIVTKMRMKGLNVGTSDKSISLQYLARYVRGQNDGGNIHLFTGTPITNTMTEIYHQMRYIMEEQMIETGVDYWDGWFGSFASELTDVELNAAAEYENVTRLASFINVPELRKMAGQYMDVVFSDDMPEMQPRETKSGKTMSDDSLTESERAELENGRTEGAMDRPYKKVINENADLTPQQKEQFDILQGYARSWRNMDGKARKEARDSGAPESPIITESLAGKASFDMRLYKGRELAGQEGKTTDHPDSKASRVVKNVLDIYNSHEKATQVIFTNMGIGKTVSRQVGQPGQKVTRTEPVFSVANDIIERLVQQGIPREQIALVTGNTDKEKRKEIADKMNDAKIRVVIGATQTLGVGVNMQKNLRAMHHMDAPWMPGDLEQRNGRGHRQGNQWNTVFEYRYITDRLDGRRWQILAIKQRFIRLFLNANDSSRIIEGDAASDEQDDILSTFSEAAGDPRILIREKYIKKIEKLQSRERLHTYAVADAKGLLRSAGSAIERDTKSLEESVVLTANINKALADNKGDSFKAKIRGATYTNRKDADAAINEIIIEEVRMGTKPVHIGEIMGFEATIAWPALYTDPVVIVKVDNGKEKQPIHGNKPSIASLTTALRNTNKNEEALEKSILKNKTSIERLKDVISEPFKQKTDLERFKQELINIDSDMTENPVPPPAWLRAGAPVDTEVFWGKRDQQNKEDMEMVEGYGWMVPARQAHPDAELVNGYGWMMPASAAKKGKTAQFVVTGHRWTADGWFVMAEDDKGVTQIPYTEVRDSQGIPIYEEKEFITPEVIPLAVPDDQKPADSAKASLNSQVSGKAGVNPKTVIDTMVSFLDSLNLSEKIVPHVYADYRRFSKATGIPESKSERARGFIKGREIYLIAGNIKSVSDILPLLRHEILAHYGLNIMDKADSDAILKKLIASRYIPFVKQHWDEVSKTYASQYKNDPKKIAEEVFGRIAELNPETAPKVLEQIVDMVMTALRKIGLFKNNMTRTEARELLKVIAKGISQGDVNSTELKAMTAWHGSAADHNKFDSGFIGTGEGSAVQGYGHYFASRREVAQFYRGALSKNRGTKGELARRMGYDAVGMEDEHGESVLVLSGKSVNAAFDPDFADSAELMASLRPEDEFHEANEFLRENDQTAWKKAKKFLRRQFAPGGLLPSDVFNEKIIRDGKFNAIELDSRHHIGKLESAVLKDYGKKYMDLPDSAKNSISSALHGRVDPSLQDATKEAVYVMRQNIDSLSRQYINSLKKEIAHSARSLNISPDQLRGLLDTYLNALASGSSEKIARQAAENAIVYNVDGSGEEMIGIFRQLVSEGVMMKAARADIILRNMGEYVHRSYQAFDDPKWFKKVDDETINNAREYLISRNIESGIDDNEAARRAEVAIHEIVKSGTAYDSFSAFIHEGKLGAKDLSIMMRRKEIAPEIKALLGEYKDARLNYTKSTTKMGRLIWNQSFLDAVLDKGMGVFLFEKDSRPPGATKQIAAANSETYSPLNGLWTYPDVEQSFRDALGKEHMDKWYETIVQLNGMVKFGKTVLSPTTAARNWQSAYFFTVMNGHFDLSHIAKSVQGLREYFTHNGEAEKLAYLRELQELGVIYDNPFAGEMMRLLGDSKIEDTLLRGKDPLKFNKALEYAQKFYQYGDDFWKIVGFENEKALLIKHAGMSEVDAKKEAAKRVRNTYPTYSMTGRAMNFLRRFPLAGTFVSFPSEIIRTVSNNIRYIATDLKTPGMRPIALRRMAGMAIASSFAYALQAVTMAMLDVDDDDEEAIRDLSPTWSKNSNLIFINRDANGQIQYIDMSYVDPYNYFKRPVVAMLRDQPWEDMATDIVKEMLTPFLGTDIAAGAIFEVISNKKESVGRVFFEGDNPLSQSADIANHLRKSLQPGVASNLERTYKAITGHISPSGKVYNPKEEAAGWLGWRVTTTDPKIAIYYRSFEFKDNLKDASSVFNKVARNPNKVSINEMKSALEKARGIRAKSFKKMSRMISAARSSGMDDNQITRVLMASNISQKDISQLFGNTVPKWIPSASSIRSTITKSGVLFNEEKTEEFIKRFFGAIESD
jgi:N12 class adenine-specific DNA methylase